MFNMTGILPSANNGFLCLLNTRDHTSILHGSEENIVPTIPQLVDVVDYNCKLKYYYCNIITVDKCVNCHNWQ